MATKRVKAAEALVDILEREGVSVIFGIPGGPLLPLYDQLAHHHKIQPPNLLHHTVHYTPLDPSEYRLLENKTCDGSALAAIAQRIAQARHPLILVGERALLPDATDEIQMVAERFSIPVATDLACKSAVDEWSPMFLGCIGVLGHKVAENYLKEKSDLVLTVGQTFNEMSTLSWDPALAAGRQLIQLDTDPEEIGKVYPVAAASVGHLPTMLACLTQKLNTLGVGRQGEREKAIASLLKQHPLFSV